MCKQGYSAEEIVEFFKTWVSKKHRIEIRMKKFMEGHQSSDKVQGYTSFTLTFLVVGRYVDWMCFGLDGVELQR